MGCATLRFESKHQFFKNIIRSSRNFINVTSTLSKRHQMFQVSSNKNKTDPFTKANNITSIFENQKTSLNSKCEFRSDSIVFREIEYKKNQFVIIGRNSSGYSLALLIMNIFFDSDFSNIIFDGFVHVMDYDSLNGSFILNATESSYQISIFELLVIFPFTTCIINNQLRTSIKYPIPSFF